MKMGTNQQFSLRWNNYVQHITCAFDNLRSDEDLVDVTLSCEGRKILAHKMLLSACSTYFKNVFKENPCKHPVIIFRNVKFEDLVAIVDFMYHGEVNVEQEQLSSFLTTAEMLAVQGLTDGSGSSKENYKEENRKRHPSLLESSLLGAVQDLSNNRSNHQQKSVPRSNIPHASTPVSFYNPAQSNRPSTPTPNRKRKFSPVKVLNSINNKEGGESESKQSKKKVVMTPVKEEQELSVETPVVPKVEVNDYDDNESSYSEQESGMMDVSQLMDKNVDKDSVELFSTNSRDSPHPAGKGEGVPGSEIDKGLGSMSDQAMLKPGTSGNVESLQEPIFIVDTEEEYLEEDYKSDIGNELEGQSEYIVVEEDIGEAEYLEEDDEEQVIRVAQETEEDDDDEESIREMLSSGLGITTYTATEEGGDGTDVEYIYAEGVSDNNEIIIGEVPRFQCKYCEASFKRLDSLYKHNSVHKGKTQCPVCKAIFSRVAHRTRHMKLKHPDVEIVTTPRMSRKKKDKADEVDLQQQESNEAFNVLSAI